MPMLSKTEVGLVIAIWGQAWVRGADGMFRALKLGDTLHKGTVVLTEQDAIVQLGREDEDDTPEIVAAAPKKTPQTLDADQAIADINKGKAEAAPAAGLGGGDGGDLQPGLRVERIAEVAPGGALLHSAGNADALTPPELLAGHEAGRRQAPTQTIDLPSTTLSALEEGPNVGVAITAPTGATQIRVDTVPAVGQLLLADGTVVHAGSTLTPQQLTGLVYAPPADYLPGMPAGEVRYSTSVGSTTSVGHIGVQITPINDAPVAGAGSSSGFEDSTLPVSLGASDVDSPIAGITIQQLPANGTLLLADGVTAVGAGQTLTAAQAAGLLYRPDPNAFGSTSITFTAIDDQGANSAPATWTLTVTAVDDLPVVGGDAFTVAEDGAITIDVLANDADPEGHALTVTQINGTPISDGGPAVAVSNGSVQLAGGQLVFTPAPNYNGPIHFTYVASDGSLQASAAVSGQVTAVADAPLTTADTFTVAEDSSVVIDVRANDSDPDGGTLTITQVNGSPIVDGGAAVAVPGGSVQMVSGQLIFTPAPDTNGPVGFTYTVSNGGLSSSGAVSGTVSAVDDAPGLNAPAAQTGAEDSALVFSTSSSNALQVSDVDGDVLTVTVSVDHGALTLASTAGVSVAGNGSASVTLSGGAAAINAALDGVSFAPTPDYNGAALLTLSVSDGTTTRAAGVPITIAAVADIVGDSVTTSEDTPVAIDVLGNDAFDASNAAVVAVNGQAISVGGAAVAVPNGSVTLTASGLLVFTPTPDYNNTPATPTAFNYTVSSGGVTETASVAVAVTPVPDVASVSLSASPSVAEGGSIVYTATLSAPAKADLTVTLGNGATITVPSGASSGSVVMAAPGDDVYLDAGTVSTSINSAAGGGYDVLNVDATPASTAITDTLDTVTVSLGASPAVAEGGVITYTATLNAPAQTPVTVQLSNGATITITAGTSSGSVSVPAPGDDAVVDAGSVSATISTASGGNFEHLAIDTAPATTAVSDTLDTTTVSVSASPSVAEGGSIVYTASLTSTAQTPVTVQLSNGATITIAAGASSGSVSVAAPGDDAYVDAGNVSTTINGASGGNFESLAIDPTAATTSISDTIDVTTVSLSASPAVAEGGSITYTASSTAPAQGAVTVTLSNGATITIAAGASSGSVSVAAPGDDVVIDAGSVSATITAASGGNFENLVVNAAPAITAVSDTLDTTTVSLSATPSVAEGGSIVYTASLTALAQTPVSVTLSSGAVITIAAGASSGSVTVAAPGDDVYVDAGSVAATISSATGGNFEALAIDPAPASTAISDTLDITTVSLTATPSVAEGGSIVYTASLTSAAQTPVTVQLSNGASITIAAGASNGTVSVAAPADDLVVDAGSVAAHIDSASGGGFESLAVNATPAVTTVSDTIDTTTVSLSGTASVVEGATAHYTVSLTSAAASAVTVQLAYSGTATDGSDFSGVASVTIPAGSSSATFDVATLDDALAEGSEGFTVTLVSATGGGFENLAISGSAGSVGTALVDNDTATIAVSDTSVVEGGFAVFTVNLSTPSTAPVTFMPTLASGSAIVGTDTASALEYFNGIGWVPVTGAGVTLAAGITSVQVRVATIDDPVADSGETFTLTATVTAGLTGNASASGTATLTDEAAPDATTVSLSATAGVAEGGSIVYTATLDHAAVTPVTVTLDNGASIVIGAGATSGSVSVAAPGDDALIDAGSVSARISNASGGGFESLAVDATPAITTVSDTIDTTTVSLTATPVVAEGGTIVYTASLTSAAQTPVTVNLSNGATITIGAGASTGSVTLAAPADDAIVDAGTVSVAISNASGGNFESLAVDPAPATTSVTDTIDTATVSLGASPSVAEGGTIVYTASLTGPADTAVTVNLSNGATIVIAAGASSGAVGVAAPADDVYVDAGSVSATIVSASGGNFENLAVNPAAAVTTVTDTTDATTVSLTASPSVAEGGFVVYSASLTAPAQSPVTVTLQSGATITIAAGASSGSVSVPAPGDNVYADAGSVSERIATATGGGFEQLAVDATPAVTAVSDTIDATTVSLNATPSVAEGGTIVYTATLTSVALTPVSLQLANGASIVIAAGASSGSVNVAAPGDDVYVDAGNVSTTIASASGGSFESLVVDPAPAVTAVADTLDTTTVSLTASPSVAEGGVIVYTATLGAPAQSAVTVTLDNGVLIHIAANTSVGTVSVAAPGDDVIIDAGTVSASISTATGGGFEQLAINAAPASTAITDTLDTTTVSLSASPAVAEGGAIVYTASLSAPADSAMTVALSNGATIAIAAGANSGSVSVAAPGEDVYADAGTVAATIDSVSGGNFEQLAIDATPAVTAVSDTIDTTTVSLSATPAIAEGGTIIYTATLTSAALSPLTVQLANGATITIGAGANSGSTAVAAPGDDVYVDAGSIATTVVSASGGGFESLAINPGAATTMVSDTIDLTTVSISGAASVVEGASASYTVSLTSPALSAVTITLSFTGTATDGSDYSGVTTLTIPANASSASVSIATLDDALFEGAESFTVSLVSATGGGFEQLAISGSAGSVTTALLDNDAVPSIAVSDSAVTEGSFALFTVSLSGASATSTTFNPVLAGGSATVGVDTANTVEFFDGSSWQPVGGAGVTIPAGSTTVQLRVATLDDAIADSGETFTLTAQVTAGSTSNVVATGTATLSDEALPDSVLVSLAGPAAVVEGAGAGAYTVSLSQAALTPVTVQLQYSGSAGDGVDYTGVVSVTIPVGTSSVAFTLPTIDDVIADSGETIVVSLGAISGGGFEAIAANPGSDSVTTTISDEAVADVATLSLAASASVAEGGSIVYTATLDHPADTPVTVTLSNGATLTIAAGASAGSVNVATPGDDVYLDAGSVSATISSASGGNFEALVVDPSAAVTTVTDTIDATTVSLAATPSIAEGGTIVYTASLTHPAGSAMTVTLSNGAVIAIAAGASSGSVGVAAPSDDAYLDAGSVAATIASTSGGNFELVAIDGTPAATTVSDTVDTTTVSLTATPSAAEGGSIVYTASLTQVAQTPVIVTLSNGASITIATGMSAGTVSVAAPGDDVYVDAGNVSATISSATGGNFEQLAINPAPATTAITDTLNTTTVSLTATPSVAEGGTIVYTASLTQVAQTPVIVTLSNGAILTIAAGASAGSVNIAAPGDDVYVDAGSVSATISSASGGNFEQLAINPAAATTAVSDTLDVSTVSLSATPAVAEGGFIVYAASLTAAAQSPVTVQLSNGATITIAGGASTGSVSVAAPGDDVYADGGTVSATITSASGGGFETLQVGGTAATTAITDTIDTTTVSLSASPSVAEGGSIVYTATLTAPAETAVTVHLANGATIPIAAGTSAGSVSLIAPSDDVYLDAGSVSTTIASAAGGNFESLVVNPSPATTAITDTVDVSTVSLSASPSVAEGGSIVYTASLSSAAQSPVTVTLSNGASITIATGASVGSVSVAAPGDDVYLDAGSVSATISSATGGNFEQLAINPAAATSAISDTIDATTVSLIGGASVIEGANASYTVSLTSPALSAVTVTLAYSGSALDGTDYTGVATVTIPAGASSATFNVATINDALAEGTESFTVNLVSASGGNFETLSLAAGGSSVTTAIVDDDVAVVSLSATPSLTEAGGTIVYTATVTQAPLSALTVTLSNGATLVINAGATSGTASVPLGASDDVYVDPSSVSAAITGTSGGGIAVVVDATPAVTAVADTFDTTTVTLSATPSVAEGDSIVYTASLTSAAQTPVTVQLSNGASITIAAGASSGTVSVSAPADDAYADAGSVSATISTATGGNFEALAINPAAAVTAISDTVDTTTVSLSATPSVAEGGTIVYTASLTSTAQSPVMVQLSNGATITIATGASSGTVSVAAPSDDVHVDAGSVSATISSASGGNFEALAINPAAATTTVNDTIDTTTVSLTATPSVAEGGNIVYTASLTSAAQSPVTVQLSNGATLSIAAGASSGTVSVPVHGDTVYVDAGAVSATISSATGGNFEALAINPAAATTAISDTINTTTVSLTATPSVAEGGNIVYTASLTNAAQTPVTVNLANGATLTIGAGTSSGTVSVPAHGDTVYVDAGTVSTTISSASGGNFEQLAINPAAASTSVTDTLNTTTLSLTATPSVTEGGNIVYTASLTNAAQTPVTVNLANGATITIAAGASSGTVSVPAHGDTAYVDAGTVSTTISSATGGNFEALAINPSAATTTVTDTINATSVSLSASASVAEGGSIVYIATLSNAAQTPVSITLSNGATITIAAGATSGSTSVVAPGDDPYVDGGSVSATISTATGGNFEALSINPAAATTTVTDTIDTTTVSLTATPSVAEGGSIVYTASLTNTAQTPVTVNLANGATITIGAGASSGTVSVPAHGDTVYVDAGTVSTTISSASGGNFEQLAVNPAAATTSVTDTLNTTTVSLTGAATVTEGTSGNYTVSLTSAAQTAVAVNLSYSGTASGGVDYSGVATVTIPAGASSATFSIATLDDALADSGETLVVSVASASGGNFESLVVSGSANSVTTTINDEATPDTVLVSLNGPGSVVEGATTTAYTVTLGQAAVTPVTVNLTYGGTATGGGTDYTGAVSVTIPAGATSATFTLPTTNDVIDEPDETVIVSLGSISGGGFEAIAANPASNSVTTTITDNDPTPSLAVNDVSVNEAAGTATFTVTLSAVSGQTVTVNYATGGGSATAGSDYTATSGALTFTPGVVTQTITVPILNDSATESSETFNVTLSGALNATIADNTGVGTIIDNDAPPVLDLDANNSSGAAGASYATTYTEQGAAVAIADADLSITDVDSTNLTGATIVLTNRQSGDVLNLPGMPAGITASVNTTPTQITITLSGSATLAQYQSAIGGITFAAGGGDTPDTTARSVTVSVTDGTSSSNVATSTIAVVAVNDAPVNTLPASISVTEDAASPIIGISASDVDAGGSTINVTLSVPAGTLTAVSGSGVTVTGSGSGALVLAGTQSAINAFIAASAVSYTTAANANGSVALTVTTSDLGNTGSGGALTDVDTVTLNITPVNDAPTQTVPGAQSTSEDTARVFSNANGNAITVADVDSALTTTVSVTNGTLSAVAFAGATITNNGSGSVTISGSPAAVNGALNGLAYNPSADYNGSATLTVTTSDGVAAPVVSTIGINVSAVSDIVGDTATTNEDTPLNIDVNANDSFENSAHQITAINGSAIAVGGTVAVANGSVTLLANGTLNFTPAADYNGAASFTYTVSAGGVTETATVNLTVNAVNDTPVNSLPGAQTLLEDVRTAINGVSVADPDEALGPASNRIATVQLSVGNGTLQVTLAGGASISAGANNSGTLTLSGSQSAINATLASLSYQGNANYVGGDTLVMVSRDGLGLTDSDSVGITVTQVNDAPSGTDKTISLLEDSNYTFARGDFGFLDAAGEGNNFQSVTVNPTAAGTLTLNGMAVSGPTVVTVAQLDAGLLRFMPPANASGNSFTSFTFQVRDDGGTANGGVDTDPTPNTITVNVTAVNDAPVNTVPGAQSTNEDTSKAITGLSIADIDAGSGTMTVTLAVTNGTLTVSGGSATISNSGTGSVTLTGTQAQINATLAANVTYVPTANFNGTATLTMTTSDGGNTGSGGTLSDVDTVSITVTPVNDAPDTNNVSVGGTEDTLITVNLTGSDIDGTVTGFVISALPANGILYKDAGATLQVALGEVVTGPVYFRPTGDFNGSTSFQYAAVDSGSPVLTDATPATVAITVTPVNDGAPVANADTFATVLGTPIVISQAQLLANDVLRDHAAISGTSAVTGGALVNNGNGTYTFTPSAAGAGSFSYTLTDEDGQTSTATVNITTFATRDDLITVYESALPNGTGGGVRLVSGNLLSNDPGATSISSVGGVTDGTASDLDTRAGYIGVQQVVGGVNAGVLTVDVSGSGIGDYTYTLNDNVDHSAAANNNSRTQAISYVTNTGTGNVQVTIVDDRPQAFDRTIDATEDALPSYNLVLVLDVSGSMTDQASGGEVRQVNADGTVSITTRLDMAKAALVELVDQYYNQAQNVSVKVITFSSTATTLNGGAAYTSKTALVNAINGITGSGGTDYTDALNATKAAFGTVDPSKQNIAYFLSDGVPTEQDTTNPATSTGYAAFAAANGISSYGVGIGSGISNTGPLNGIHNVDADGSGTVDPAIIVPDLNELANTLLSTVPVGMGGSVVSGSGVGNALGADDGYVQSITVALDTDGNAATPQVNVTFSYNAATNQISWSGGFPSGSPATGDTLTLNSAKGFTHGALTFNFDTGQYTYYTAGVASEGDSFSISYVARDNDGDVTNPTTLTFNVIDGQPIARPDFDTLFANQTSYTGNVISGLSTDGGLAVGSLTTDFSAQGSGTDVALDDAKVSSIVFQGQTFNLASNVGSTAALGGTYTVTNGQLVWTHASNGSSLRFNSDGSYQYVPTAAETPSTPSTGPTNVTLTGANATGTTLSIGGMTFSGIARDSTSETGGVRRTSGDGIGVNINSPGTDDTTTVGNLETLVIRFDGATNPYGVENVTIDADNSNNNLGGSVALTYTAYHIDGHMLGRFYSDSDGAVTVPPEYSNIGRIDITANSDAYASIGSVSYDTITNSAAAEIAPISIGYTLTDSDGDTSSSSLTLRPITNSIAGDANANTLTGGNANDYINGGAGNDTIDGGAGHDLLVGGAGNDVITGGAGHDILRGGDGNDVLNGGDGNDLIVGGAGNDTMAGGNGADVFAWALADRGAPGTPAVDTIQNFDGATAAAGGDVIDLRDLLQGEHHDAATVGNLQNYLHFETSGGNTTIQISSTGGFVNGYNTGAVDQTIVLQGVNLLAGMTTDQQVIQDLLNKGKLVTDAGG